MDGINWDWGEKDIGFKLFIPKNFSWILLQVKSVFVSNKTSTYSTEPQGTTFMVQNLKKFVKEKKLAYILSRYIIRPTM